MLLNAYIAGEKKKFETKFSLHGSETQTNFAWK